jgi:neutral ceramidase
MRMQRLARGFAAIGLLALVGATVRGDEGLKAGAAAEELKADDSLVIGGGIGPGKARGQEGTLRASALVVEDRRGARVCLVACDVLMIARDVLDRAARRIEAATGIPFDHILINATHTHHAPTTVTIHGYEREEGFTKHVEEQIIAAALAASKKLTPVTFLFRLGEESSVGRNSRLLLSDGTIFWTGSHADAVRPTGPFDPELPVLAFRKPNGAFEAIAFNHSTHTIGTHAGAVRSPSFYGMAAQEIEREKGGLVVFFSGASGSTHNLDLKAPEMTLRIKTAVEDALAVAAPRPVDRVKGVRKELTVRVRRFDEQKDDAAVVSYCTKRMGSAAVAQPTIEVFRKMRKVLAPMQGQERKTWVQALLIGDIALVGVPGEFFTVLGEDIKRRSPYRYTYVFQLANDYVGYIPDKAGFDRGGYQTWTGLHSFLERGTGETIVAEAVALLNGLHAEPATASSRR